MKRIFMLLTLILALMCPALAGAAEVSSDRMILDWTTSKVWVNGGEQQRVILARALTQQTECLVLDEPTNHLDIKYQLQIMDIVKSLDLTVVAAVHDLNIAAMYCDRLVAIKDGQIVGMGTPRELLTEKFIYDMYEVRCRVDEDASGRINIVYLPQHWQ